MLFLILRFTPLHLPLLKRYSLSYICIKQMTGRNFISAGVKGRANSMNIKQSAKRLCALILSLTVFLCFTASASGPDIPGEDPDGAVAVDTTLLNVSARCAVLLEAETGSIVYEKNAEEIRPMASTTKIMTALVALEAGEMSKEVIVSEEAVGLSLIHICCP